ncbi:MAG: hypothetical protein R3E53_18535 [Myxococcota bacterium]
MTGLSSEVQTGRLSFAVVELRNPAQDGLRVQVQHQYERVETPFANFDVAMGEYHFDDVSLRLEASRNRPVGGRIQVLRGLLRRHAHTGRLQARPAPGRHVGAASVPARRPAAARWRCDDQQLRARLSCSSRRTYRG